MKIAYALKNFDCLRSEYSDLDYCVIEKVSELSEKL